MYYQNYDDYMRNVLGYNQTDNYPNLYANGDDFFRYQSQIPMYQNNFVEDESLYPDIYHVVKPMVCKACNEVHTREITENLVNEITDKIYESIETNDIQETRTNKNGDVPNPNVKEETRHSRVGNPLLRDLIKILVLRNLYDRRRRPPMPRPPFIGGPGQYPPPPPPMPRFSYEDLY